MPKAFAKTPAPEFIRREFPDLVNPKTGCFKSEVSVSLKTSDPAEAKRRGRKVGLALNERIAAARKALAKGPTPDAKPEARPIDADEVAHDLRASWLAWDDDQRDGDERRDLMSADERGSRFDRLAPLRFGPGKFGMEHDAFQAYGEFLEEEAASLRDALARRDTTEIEPEVVQFLKVQGRELPADQLACRNFLLRVLEQKVKTIDDLLARQAGKVVETPQVVKVDRGPKLSEAFRQWKVGGGAKGTRSPAANSVVEADQAVRRFIELHGDLCIGAVTRAHAREYRDALAKIPARLPKPMRDLPIKTLLAKDLSSYPARDAATVNKLLAMLGGIVSRAEAEGQLDGVPGFTNPFDKTIRYKKDSRAGDSRVAFDAADLKALFASPVFARGLRPAGGGGEAAFWFPLIALLSGMRLEEMAGLRVCDLRTDDATSRWFFDVTPDSGRTVKTSSSIRAVPVHPLLIRAGLLMYRQARLDGGAKQTDGLWPEVVSGGGRPASAAWSKWCGRYLRDTVGIGDTRKVFHSFRHTFKRMARDAGLDEPIHDALTGHSGRGSVGRSYGRGYSLKPLIEAMDRIEVPSGIGLEKVVWG